MRVRDTVETHTHAGGAYVQNQAHRDCTHFGCAFGRRGMFALEYDLIGYSEGVFWAVLIFLLHASTAVICLMDGHKSVSNEGCLI